MGQRPGWANWRPTDIAYRDGHQSFLSQLAERTADGIVRRMPMFVNYRNSIQFKELQTELVSKLELELELEFAACPNLAADFYWLEWPPRLSLMYKEVGQQVGGELIPSQPSSGWAAPGPQLWLGQGTRAEERSSVSNVNRMPFCRCRCRASSPPGPCMNAPFCRRRQRLPQPKRRSGG